MTRAVAAGLAVLAAAMAVLNPTGGSPPPRAKRTAATAGCTDVTVTVHPDGTAIALTVAANGGSGQQVSLMSAGRQSVDGVDLEVWQRRDDLARRPDAVEEPGRWSASTVFTVLAHGDDVVSAERVSSRVATLRGGGLTDDWRTTPGDDREITPAMTQSAQNQRERTLWTRWLPTTFAVPPAPEQGHYVGQALFG